MIIADLNEETIARHLGPLAADYPFPFQPEYARALRRHMGKTVQLVVSDCGTIALPIARTRTRWCRLAQILFPPLQAGERLEPPAEGRFLDQLVSRLASSRACDRLLQPPPHCLFQAWPRAARACDFGSYVLDLRQRVAADILRAMDPTHRYEIRAAERLGITCHEGPEQLERFYPLYQQTWRRSGKGVEPRAYFEDLLREGAKRWICASACTPGGEAMGAVLVACSSFGGFYLYGASADRVVPPGAIKLLHWHVINRLLTIGARRYDFVGARLSDVKGTKLEGVQSFKARFGGTLERGTLWKMDIRPFRTHLHDSAKWLWRLIHQRGPIEQDIIDQEIMKVAPVGSIQSLKVD